MAMRIPPVVITREHGSWAVFGVPLLIGFGIAWRFPLDALVLLVAAFAAFLASVPAQRLVRGSANSLVAERFWVVIYGLVAFVAGVVLLARGYAGVLAAAALAACAFAGSMAMVEGRRKTAWSDLVASAGLSLGAPMAYYVASGTSRGTVILYVVTLLWFGWSMVHVHVKLRAAGGRARAGAFNAGRPMIIYLVGLWMILAALVWQGSIPAHLLPAFVPATIHGIVGVTRLDRRTDFKRLGFLLLGQSLLFAILTIIASRLTLWPA